MNVRITALRRTEYPDLSEKYENPLTEACTINIGDVYISVDAQRPEGFCESAWESMRPFVEELSKGGGNFFDGWMKNPHSALISCNDGFRPVRSCLNLFNFFSYMSFSVFRLCLSVT